jgi:hypothetical protein
MRFNMWRPNFWGFKLGSCLNGAVRSFDCFRSPLDHLVSINNVAKVASQPSLTVLLLWNSAID